MTKRNQPELPDILREAGVCDDAELRETLAQLTPPAKAPPQLLRERLLATVARPRLRFAPLFGALADCSMSTTAIWPAFSSARRRRAPG